MNSVFTIGHSTREIGEFIALLKEHNIQLLIDVRRYPGSRRNPQFNKEAFAQSLKRYRIPAYEISHDVANLAKTVSMTAGAAKVSKHMRIILILPKGKKL